MSGSSRRARVFLLGFFVAALAVVLASCTQSKLGTRYDAYRAIDQNEWNESMLESFGARDALVLYEGYIIDDQDLDEETMVIDHYVRIRVLSEQGIEDYGEAEIPYAEDEKIIGVHARTVHRDGTVVEVPSTEIYEKTIASLGKQAMKAKTFAFKAVSPGDILEYYYTREMRAFTPPPLLLQHRHPTVEASVKWFFKKMPPGANVGQEYYFGAKYVITNRGRAEMESAETPAHDPRECQIHLRNIPPFPEEPFVPAPEVYMTTFFPEYFFPYRKAGASYWNQVSDGLGEFTREYVKKSPSLDEWMREEPSGDRNLDSDIEWCVQRMRSSLRVRGFESGDEATSDPLPPARTADELLARGTGYTLDMDNLLVAMLRRLGHDATTFWVRDRSEGILLEKWESWRQFTMSGVVAKSGREMRWVAPGFPLGDALCLPWEMTGCRALLANTYYEEKNPFSMWADVPLPDSKSNRIDTEVILFLEAGEGLKGALRASLDCKSDVGFIHTLPKLDAEDRFAALRERVLPADLAWTASNEQYEQVNTQIVYACSLVLSGAVEQAGDRLLVDLSKVRTDNFVFPDRKRALPIDVGFPIEHHSEVRFICPGDLRIEEIPAGAHWKRGSVRFDWVCQKTEDGLRIQRDVVLSDALFGKEAAEPLRTVFQEIYAKYREPFVLVSRSRS